MQTVFINLFGRFRLSWESQCLLGLEFGKVQALFAYLVLYRSRSHSREVLSSLLWGDCSTAVAKKYLRQALWQIQGALETTGSPALDCLLEVEIDWVKVSEDPDISVDVEAFEVAFGASRDTPGARLDTSQYQALRHAIDLYQGDVLEGYYYDWCLFERERLQSIYLRMLDKLAAYCLAHRQYESGLDYSMRILRYDRARECTYRRLMCLYAQAGDRSGALRQYEQCVAMLRDTLGVEPTKRTVDLYERIRNQGTVWTSNPPQPTSRQEVPPAVETVPRLKQLTMAIGKLQRELALELERLERPPGGK
jgi:DNA-binding SARP family transcriptional activator